MAGGGLMANKTHRSARVGELIRRVVAEGLEELDDERLDMVSITSVEVDRELSRAIVWFTTLDDDDDPEVEVAFAPTRRPAAPRSGNPDPSTACTSPSLPGRHHAAICPADRRSPQAPESR